MTQRERESVAAVALFSPATRFSPTKRRMFGTGEPKEGRLRSLSDISVVIGARRICLKHALDETEKVQRRWGERCRMLEMSKGYINSAEEKRLNLLFA